jgi:DNA-binding PadR family transcriptional regulator
MALKHAVLTSLLDGPASGYELAKRMDISVANFWHATPPQIYAELRRMADEGLVEGTEVSQIRRPNKCVYTVTERGRDELWHFTRAPTRPRSIKDELLVQLQAADAGDMAALADAVDVRREEAEQRLEMLEGLMTHYLRGRDEETFLATARRIGPYFNLRRGRDFERENIAWYRWTAEHLRARAERRAVEDGRARPLEAEAR